MPTQVTYRADDENNAEVWWDAFHTDYPTLADADPELYHACRKLDLGGFVTLHDPRLIEAFDTFVTGLEGWASGPAHARTALVAQAK